MYKNFKSYRHYLNAKLHGMSVTLSGDNTLLESLIWESFQKREPEQLPLVLIEAASDGHDWKPSATDLTDDEAKQIYKFMLGLLQGQQQYVKSTGIAGHSEMLTDKQRRAIISLSKYRLGMSQEAAFSYVLETFPEKRKRLTSWEIENCKLTKLYSLMTRREASTLIKRLDKFYKNTKNQKGETNEKISQKEKTFYESKNRNKAAIQ